MCREFSYETSIICKMGGKIYVKRAILRPITLSRDNESHLIGYYAYDYNCTYREEIQWPIIDLSGAELSKVDLSGADLSGAHLSGAELSSADLRGAHLSGAELNGLDLHGADLRGADLRGTNLSEDNLSGADLRSANLSGADLRRAILYKTILKGARYNTKEMVLKYVHEKIYKIPPTQWPKGFDLKAAGIIEDNNLHQGNTYIVTVGGRTTEVYPAVIPGGRVALVPVDR